MSVTYYVKRKLFEIDRGFGVSTSYSYEWELRMQAQGIGRADPQQVSRVFPAPPLEDQTVFDSDPRPNLSTCSTY